MIRAVNWWAATGALLALTQRSLGEHRWVAAVLPLLAWTIAGLVLLGLALSKMRSSLTRPAALRGGATLLAAAALFFPIASVGDWATERLRFTRERPTYERIVAEVHASMPRTSSGTAFLEQDGLSYMVDAGPHVRVAFLWPGGILDNWCGAVFDLSGEVMKVNDLELGTAAWRQHPITHLFGGDMTSCRRLDERYYLCCFT